MEKKQIKEKRKIDCCHVAIALAIVFCVIIITCFAMFFSYSAKLSRDGIEITKLNKRTEELEKKNGKELRKIEELGKEVKRLEEIIRKKVN